MIWFWIPVLVAIALTPRIAYRVTRYVHREYRERHDYPIGW